MVETHKAPTQRTLHGEWESEYPFADHWLSLPGDGPQMHYVDEGTGAPLLFLHGNPTWSFHFRHLIEHFRGSRRVIAPDHIGCGLSDKPQEYGYTLKQHIDNAQALVEHLDLRNIVLGLHDWGGAIGMGLSLRVPERVRGFLIFNTAAFASRRMPLSIGICRIPGIGALAIRGFNAFVRGALARCAVKPLTAAAKAGYLAPYTDWSSRVANLRFVQDIPVSESHESWATLAEIEAGLASLADRPMRIFWGAKDFVFNDEFLAGWRKRFPDAEVTRFEQAGHFVIEDARDEIIAGTESFLEGLA